MEQQYSRIDLAVEQLEIALRLFLKKESFVSALTLAGASEEILGKQLTFQSEETTLDSEFITIKPVREHLDKEEFLWKSFIGEKNRVRNAAKHMRDKTQATVFADIEDEALWMIVRACDNYNRLGLAPTSAMTDFDNWFYENVVGI